MKKIVFIRMRESKRTNSKVETLERFGADVNSRKYKD
jgi:hypothetical protein